MAMTTSPFPQQPAPRISLSRRDFLWQSGGGLGGIALASLLPTEGLLAANPNPQASRRPDSGLHHAPKAKRTGT